MSNYLQDKIDELGQTHAFPSILTFDVEEKGIMYVRYLLYTKSPIESLLYIIYMKHATQLYSPITLPRAS